MSSYPITPEGKEFLEQKLQHLRNVERFKIVKDIEEARAHGDISENSEYEDAKERQALCEGMISDLEAKLSLSQVIDVTTLPGADLDPENEHKKIVFGATIVLEDEEGHNHVFRIVGVDESNVDKGYISIQTPVAKALLGKCPGDTASVVLPKSKKEYEVIAVYYGDYAP